MVLSILITEPSSSLYRFLNRRLRLQPHDKFVALGVNEFFTQCKEGERSHRDNEGEVEAPEREHEALPQRRGHGLFADQCPLTPPAVLPLVLHGGTGRQVTLQEGLKHSKNSSHLSHVPSDRQ